MAADPREWRESEQGVGRLLRLTTALSEEQELNDSLKLVADAALELLPAQNTTVRMLDEHGALVSAAQAVSH